jgi:HAMP domain-containing protein/HPt (histidine-containing phosphotransfer) domain-containing protein
MVAGLLSGRGLRLSLRLKLYLGLVLFALAGLGAGGVLVDRNVRSATQADVEDRLSYETTMLGQMTANALFGEIDPTDTSLNAGVRALGKAVRTQLSVIANTGAVVADSESEAPLSLPSQLDLPEVVAARATGTGTSVRAGRIFVANSIVSDGKTLGVARSSVSTDVVEAHVRDVRRRIEYGALVAVLMIVVLGYAISSRLVSPLRALAAGAQRVGAGDLSHPIAVTSRDEIAELSTMFNDMTGSLRENIEKLDARNRDLRLVLDNVNQGLLTMDREGVIRGERSAVLDRWFGKAEGGVTFWDYIEGVDPLASAMFLCAWEALLEETMPFEVSFDQLPPRMTAKGRWYELRYTVLEAGDRPADGTRSGNMTGLLITISDVTARIDAERAEGEQREIASAFERIMKEKSGFVEFFAEAQELVEELRGETRPPLPVVRRLLHTLKGNAAIFGLSRFASLCHEVEDRIAVSGADLSARDREDLVGAWERLARRLKTLLGERAEIALDVDDEDYAGLLRAVVDGRPRREVVGRIAGLKLERVETRLQRYASQARGLAARLGKTELDVEVHANRLRLSREALTPFWASFTHVVRNAVDHGVEYPDERAKLGKPATARLTLSAARAGDQVVIELTDDGRGVDWAAVSDRARAFGLPRASHRDLVDALFHDGLSTKADVSELSGRGVGLAAARGECERLDGSVSVTSEPGRGATFRFSFPSENVTMLDAGVRDLLRGVTGAHGAAWGEAWSETWEVATPVERLA